MLATQEDHFRRNARRAKKLAKGSLDRADHLDALSHAAWLQRPRRWGRRWQAGSSARLILLQQHADDELALRLRSHFSFAIGLVIDKHRLESRFNNPNKPTDSSLESSPAVAEVGVAGAAEEGGKEIPDCRLRSRRGGRSRNVYCRHWSRRLGRELMLR
jgi:hypothetical protein